jgi:hypothetical protein
MLFTQEGYNYWNTNENDPTHGGFIMETDDGNIIYHNMPRNKDGTPNIYNTLDGVQKWTHPVYGYEIITDSNGNIMQDPINASTYNFTNDSENWFMHGIDDVVPYYIYGTSDNDQTKWYQRVWRAFQ